ncbi:hypothetical protein R6U77_17155 [Lysinibacillus louembei]|uniref:BclA C-terminal domain-containing protein n=1 Tax=Lysinibacillus louembei TaxID=1470088 RepID=A0ABZ0RXQ4_9BACI|nr:hypothetical protein [Lysinibacillus louembei]WPK11598.1 hypothetical protein R6U77_17155 [Lysinibacillus louembei]
MSFNHSNKGCHKIKYCPMETKFFGKFIAGDYVAPNIPPEERTMAFGSLRSNTLEDTATVQTPVSFDVVGPLSNVTVSPTGNELVVNESGVYQVTVSINAIAFAAPDPTDGYLSATITVNGMPIFTQGIAVFNITSRNSSAYIVQAALNAGDQVGVSAASEAFLFGYMNRSLTLLQLQ